MSDDISLLRRYAANSDEAAFEELVQRHMGLVYSAALRQTSNAHLAEDVTQTVFLRLARKAGSLPEGVVLAGWLHSDTRLTALQALRTERRRKAREEAEMDRSEGRSDWTEVRPIIDESLAELEAGERDAVLLRFFGDRSFAEVGAALRLAPDAARMRVNRGLEKLREQLEKRGIKTTATALGAILLAQGIEAVPVGMAGRVVTAALKTGAGIAVRSAWQEWVFGKGMAAAGVALLLMLGGLAAWQPWQSDRGETVQSGEARTQSEPALLRPVQAQEIKGPSTTPETPGTGKLRLRVVEEGTGAALAGVKVEASLFTDLLRSRRETMETGPDGTVEIRYPTEHEHDFHHRLKLSKDGYVARYVSWSVYQKDGMKDIPAEYVATMPKGTEIGGLVWNEGGEPIAGVKLVFSGPSSAGVDPRERDTVMGRFHTEVTDATGRWHCSHLRPEFQTTTFELQHPAYQPVTYGCEGTTDPSQMFVIRLPDASFRKQSAAMKMTSGLPLHGMVTERGGGGIAGAKLTQNREWTKESSTTVSSENGEFTIRNAMAGGMMLSVQAAGFAPETKELSISGGRRNETRFELTRSVGWRGRVVEESGLPVKSVEVEYQTDPRWRKIYNWSARTDDLGDFYWDSSPNEAFTVTVWGYGFERTDVVALPGNDVQIITLTRSAREEPVVVRGTAADESTGQPVEGAEVYLLDSTYGTAPFHKVGESTKGEFVFELRDRKASYQIELRKTGYDPARSKQFKIEPPPEAFALTLKKGEGARGVVLRPDGKPAVGAEVALCTTERRAILGKRKFLFTEESSIVRTDEEGKFAHKSETGAHRLYAVHESGYAEVRLKDWANGGALQLQAWGRIEGKLTLGGEAGGGQELMLEVAFFHGIEQGMTFYGIKATTEENGRFVFEDVPPIEVRLVWLMPSPQGRAGSHAKVARVEPGKTTEIDYAVEGNTVVGKLIWKGEGQVDWSKQARGSLMPQASPKPWENSPGYADADVEGKRRIEFEFPYTEAGRERMRRHRPLALMVREDGTFEVLFVPPGSYTVSISVRQKPEEARGPGFGRTLAHVRQDVVVPGDCETCDIGEVIVVPRP